MIIADLNKIYVGATEVSKVYLGSNLLYPLIQPTNGIVDDINNTFTFTPAIGYSATQHEFRYKFSGDDFTSWVECETNVIVLHNIDIPIGGVEVRVMGLTGTLKNTVAFTMQTPTMAYVETTGNDGTGTIDDISKPFLTISAALTALTSYPIKKVKIGLGDFVSPGTVLINNITLEGSGQPVVNIPLNPTKLINGTVLKGNLKISSNNTLVKNLGIDNGKAWVDLGNPEKDGLSIAGIIAGGIYTNFVYNNIAENITTLCKNANSAFHGFLFEHTINPIAKNIITYYGLHGIVYKTKYGTGINLQSFGNNYNGLIIKADTANNEITKNILINGYKYRDINGSKCTKAAVYIESTSAVAISAVKIFGCDLPPTSPKIKIDGTVSDITVKDLNDDDVFNDTSILLAVRNHFKFEETSGDRLDTISSASLTANGSPSSVIGKIGDAVLISDNNLFSDELGSLTSVYNQATVNFWLKVSVNSSYFNVLIRADGAADRQYTMYINSGKINLACSSDGVNWAHTTNASIAANTWTMVTLVNTSGSVVVYTNGSYATSTGGFNMITPLATDFYISTFDASKNITLDEMTFWDRGLSASEISYLYNSGSGKAYPFT